MARTMAVELESLPAGGFSGAAFGLGVVAAGSFWKYEQAPSTSVAAKIPLRLI
jgi:hypothetical protein